MKYNDLSKEVNENAVAHGWYSEPRSYGEILALVSSELSEALEEARDGKPSVCCKSFKANTGCEECKTYKEYCCHKNEKPEGVAVELADAMLRILSYAGHRGLYVDKIRDAMVYPLARWSFERLGDLITKCNEVLTRGYSPDREPDEETMAFRFAYVLYMLETHIEGLGEVPEEVIRLKHEYNRNRPVRHGGKLL